jgi:hypothetical protein
MRKLLLLVMGCSFFVLAKSQSSTQTLDIVSWNITWFGHTSQYPPDDNLQEANARKILRFLNADLYGLTEIVDTSRLRKLADSLGNNYGYVVSPYSSGNTTGVGSSWLTAQKLAFIFNKNIFTNVSARGMMRNSATAYYNYASGRFPFLLSSDVVMNGVTKRMHFILLHGKAGSSVSDYERRRDATKELKDTLDTYFSSASVIIIGDYNDALDTTICTTCPTTISSYDDLIKDSVDSDHYVSLTLPLARAGQASMTSYPNLIDNHVVSNEVAPGYVPNSISVRTDVVPLVVQYAATTSDHYPVFSQFQLNNIITGIFNPSLSLLRFRFYPNPIKDQLFLVPERSLHHVSIRISDAFGRTVYAKSEKYIPSAGLALDLSKLSNGLYFIQVDSKEGSSVSKIIK